MGTEQPDTERMHRLFDDALADADLTGDVVPGVLAGYEQKVKVRRYQSVGMALAVVATAGAAISLLPHGDTRTAPTVSTPAPQGPDYCKHQQWGSMTSQSIPTKLSQDPAAEQANCEALQTALRATVPDAQLLPEYRADLSLDPRVDQSQVTKVAAEMHSNPKAWSADTAKYFGSELKYLSVHPEDPANVYVPGFYSLITSAGRERIMVGLRTGATDYGLPEPFVGSIDADDCAKMPAPLIGKYQCTPAGRPDGWHGTLWKSLVSDPGWQTAAIIDREGQELQFYGEGSDVDDWYQPGTYTTGDETLTLTHSTWINRWTGQTVAGQPPASHAMTQQQWARFIASPALQKYADGYLHYAESH